MKVLLVDDSATMRTIQHRCLNKLGIQDIVEAEDGRLALDQFGQNTFDIVLTDWNMPNMDGLEFLKAMKANPDWKSVPVLMVTTEGSQDKVIQALQLGASGYVKKPFTPEQIKEKLATAF